MVQDINEHASELGKLGASKGGKARAASLTPEHRKEIARNAVRVRWARAKGELYPPDMDESGGQQVSDSAVQVLSKSASSTLPVSLFPGTLSIGALEISCHVLDNAKRVVAMREVVNVLTGNRKGGLARYLTNTRLSNYIDLKDIERKTIRFLVPGNNSEAIGFEATLLIDICDAYLRARADKVLTKQQLPLAVQAEIIVRSTAKIGIEALIDEATGYQAVRAKNALQLKLQAFIADEMQEWARMFPEEFWFQLARLENIHYSQRSRPLRWGKYVMAFVYDAVDKDVGQELRKKNPDPHFGKNHHQWLKEFGRSKVRDHLNQVLGVMKTCQTMDDFNKTFGYVFKKSPYQSTFFDLVDVIGR